MAYPPHVRRLLISLTKDQARFQMSAIEAVRAIRVLAGMLIAVTALVAFWGMTAMHPLAHAVLSELVSTFGMFGVGAYGILCAALLGVGIALMAEA